MAKFYSSGSPKPIEIDKFYGIDETAGETQLKLGYATKQINCRITQNYKPQKRQGHNTFIDYENEKDVQGLWYGDIGDKEVLISCNDGKVYEYNFADEINTEIGTITDAKTSMLFFKSKLYFLNGTDYKEYDGTTFQDVVPYIPKVATVFPPSGGEPNFEPINLLTGSKKTEFLADGIATQYFITEQNVSSIDSIKVNGVETSVTKDLVNGKVTFSVAPIDEAEVIIQWTKAVSGNADLIKKHKYMMTFGVSNDTSIFIWGNPDEKNARRWCATENAGYFPTTNLTNIGTDEYAITDIKTNGPNYQIIFKENATHYSKPEYIVETETWDFPVYDLNEKVGNITFGGVQIIKNSPISIYGQSWRKWNTAYGEDERNEDVISERLRNSLSKLDLTTAITFDNQVEKEYWCNVGDKVYIWNYGNDTMYTYDNITATCFLDIKVQVYYGSKGTIERFEGLNDNETAIIAQLYLAFTDFEAMELLKTSNEIYVSIQPDTRTSATIYYQTNKQSEPKALNKKAEYQLLDFDDTDFDNLSFMTNRNPQTFPLRLNARDYTVIRFMIENKELNESLLFLSMRIEAETTGQVR